MRQVKTPWVLGHYSDTEPPILSTIEIHACFIGEGTKVHLVEVPVRGGQRLFVAHAVCYTGEDKPKKQLTKSPHLLPDDLHTITCQNCIKWLDNFLHSATASDKIAKDSENEQESIT